MGDDKEEITELTAEDMEALSGGVGSTGLLTQKPELPAECRGKLAELSQQLVGSEGKIKHDFDVGQYKVMLETTETITKSLVNEAKSIAQRTG